MVFTCFAAFYLMRMRNEDSVTSKNIINKATDDNDDDSDDTSTCKKWNASSILTRWLSPRTQLMIYPRYLASYANLKCVTSMIQPHWLYYKLHSQLSSITLMIIKMNIFHLCKYVIILFIAVHYLYCSSFQSINVVS